MYAIIAVAGKQFKVTESQYICVPALNVEEGERVNFDQVLLVEDKSNVTLGAPVVEGATVTAKVLAHVRGEKITVFKKKRRKGYKKTQGHRQHHTRVRIESISR